MLEETNQKRLMIDDTSIHFHITIVKQYERPIFRAVLRICQIARKFELKLINHRINYKILIQILKS